MFAEIVMTPELVIGVLDTVKMLGASMPTLVTVPFSPHPAPVELMVPEVSVYKQPATVEPNATIESEFDNCSVLAVMSPVESNVAVDAFKIIPVGDSE